MCLDLILYGKFLSYSIRNHYIPALFVLSFCTARHMNAFIYDNIYLGLEFRFKTKTETCYSALHVHVNVNGKAFKLLHIFVASNRKRESEIKIILPF